MIRLLALAALLAAPAPAPAPALARASEGAEPAVPPFVQALVARKAGSLAYVPTRLPLRYRYRSYRWDPSARALTLRFGDERFPPAAARTVVFTVEPWRKPLARCGDGRVKTLQMGGNRVYWDGSAAWRCQRGPDGRVARLSATHPTFPEFALGRVVASGKRVGAARG